ncbi:hypothetical protein, variant [Phytophthora nicotianae P10297]|uniref:Uncharacterized protein n=1 Tax=Phytophthora nicotianae P10297 TaxID=1317064 RepID=W3A6I1_PHYNI|nr:hypothetical protein F442_00543 [Phytophthora nicotianae P10297]ETP54835.1 hypothetical protein, variant [Phytophthora nicotianae P10297]
MNLLDSIRRAVLKQLEEEAVNLFSSVRDFREFITTTCPTVDVCVTLKMCCVHVERLEGTNATRVVLVDGRKCVEVNAALDIARGCVDYLDKHDVVQVTVWDSKRSDAFAGDSIIVFHVGGMYIFHHVEYVGLYGDVAKGSVQFEHGNLDKVRELAPPLKKRMDVTEVSP